MAAFTFHLSVRCRCCNAAVPVCAETDSKKGGKQKEALESVIQDIPKENVTEAEKETKAEDSPDVNLKKKKKEIRKSRDTKSSAQTLDTSQLLKKKMRGRVKMFGRLFT